MSWLVLSFNAPGSKGYFYQASRKHGLNYLRYERLRGFVPLDQINEPRGIPRELPDTLLIQAMLEDGVTLQMIEDVLEARVSVEEAG
ncbi:MAG TPA: hypothetical protein VEJ63_17895 [Planctomycetota bacterium]|nr:hypothetical protein [Planctomycetota bacterium]